MSSENNMFDEIVGNDEALEKVQEVKVEIQKEKVEKVETKQGDGEVEMPKPASGMGGKYFKMSKEKHAIRLFSFGHEGKQQGCIPTVKHWADGKFNDCSGAGCEFCNRAITDKTVTKSVKYRVNMVDRTNKPNKVQIWEMPASAYKDVHKYFINNGSDKTFGNKGRTFLLEYFKQDKKYSMTPYEKDTSVLEFKSEEIYDLLDGDSRDMEDSENDNLDI